MANSMTKKQVEELNNRCKNGWKFDVTYFIYHQEKTFIKRIKLESEGYLEFRIYYNNQNQIAFHISKFSYIQDKACATTEGLGKITVIDNTKYTRKNINNIIIVTARLTDEELLKINSETKVSEGGGLFLSSNEF